MKRPAIVFLFLLLASLAAAGAQRRKPPHVTFDVLAINDAATRPVIAAAAVGDAVLRAQILLDRAHFSVGEIDGHFGPGMEQTVKSYQAAHRLPADGVMTADTWQALNADAEPALVEYTVTPQDAAGPFVKIPKSMTEMAKLSFAGYQSPLEQLAERFHAAPKLLQILNPGRIFGRAGEQILVPDVKRAPLRQVAAAVVVRRACSCVELLDGENNIVAHYPATMGSVHDPLPIGEWKIGKPIQNPVFHYNPKLFWDAKPGNPETTIKPGPNNPVGLNWIPFSKDHYGIHGTPDPGSVGKAQSHGCIRLTNWDVSELAGIVVPDMTASLREK